MSLDLEALRRSEPVAAAPARGVGRRFVTIAVILALAVAAFFVLRPMLFPPRRVATAAVRVVTGPARRATAAEAAGWIEPDPYPTIVRPLVDGVVASIDVLEGAEVKANATVIGRLRSAPLEAALERAERTLVHRQRHIVEAEAERDQANAVLEQRLDLRREVARLEGEVALSKAAKTAAEAEVTVAVQQSESAHAESSAQETLERSGAGIRLDRAKALAAMRSAEAMVEAKKAELERAAAVVTTADALLRLAREGLEHPEALKGEAATAEAHLHAAMADVDSAKTDRDIAAREVGWLTVLAPIDGVVLRREAAPGSNVGPSAMPRGGESGGQDSGMGGLVSLYDPKRLQARINVPFSSVAGIGAGRRVELTVEAIMGRTFHGVVTRLQSEADVKTNALQVKVRIEDPDPLLKPEMLVRARFLAEAAPVSAANADGSAPSEVRILVPKAAIKGGAVFVVDPRGGGRARRVPVVAVAEDGDFEEVKGDVSVTQRVIVDEVEDGERVDGGGA